MCPPESTHLLSLGILNRTPEESFLHVFPDALHNSYAVSMFVESLDGPSMGGYDHNPPFTPDFGLHPHGSSHPRHNTHQRLQSVYSPPSTLPALHPPEGISQSRSGSPHMSQLNFLPQNQTEAYNGNYLESPDNLESAGSTALPNMTRVNTPFSQHNLTRNLTSTSYRAVCRHVLLCHAPSDGQLSRTRPLTGPQLGPPSGQAGRLSYPNRSANYKKK